ncbi:hypothetical protein UAY_02526 [Enterococcus moraviensis ATCC BAA-383]|uniref:WxL domain-containing protein n=1 Tax=Enterococcus moraviensis ATCC BAA-383 TaxID=1158609 RepID=R2QKY1_9ENTE|nr:hypothetical protein [Enterococcus moraviensis]EOH97252.1 hypothetical protein UAY_02526 [Enterococcus moraviensis ATCC BAA-383]EOT71570.1 hypothetical protein I586_01377 [Enterococcus moraviensis ATCC BAA-383]OJG66642.1 hypothetical protein RV09_GL000789 [Enterococcus moraviensis]
MKKKWVLFLLLGGVLSILQIAGYQVFAEEELENELVEAQTQEINTTEELQERLVSVGSGSLSGTYTTGTTGQSVITMTYTYTPALDLSLGGQPRIILQLPPEIANQINGSTAKQQSFLSLLTGTVVLPNGAIGNKSYDIHDTAHEIVLAYSSAYNSVYVTFPSNILGLLGLSRWSVSFTFDVATLYQNGITIPPASNGVNYPIKGTFGSSTDGLDIINLVLGNVSKSGVIALPSMSIGTSVPNVTAPIINSPILNLQTTVGGKIQQVQNSGYTYTVQLTITRSDGTSAPIVISNIPVDAAGNFTTNVASALQYGDTLSATILAQSKTSSNYIQSLPSNIQSVTWPIQPVTSSSATPGTTQLSGNAVQTSGGTYQVALQINSGTIYTTPLNANGSFQFTNLPMFNGGETVTLSVRGLSNRTGAILVTSTNYSQIVPYLSPAISVVQIIERLNAQGNWEVAPSVVTGQTVRYTLTTTLTNQPATWSQQMLKAYIPNGITQLSPVTLIRTSNTGVQTPVLGTQLLTDSNMNMQYWYYQNPLAINNFIQPNTSFTLQYTGTVAQNMTGKILPFSSIVSGADGGGTAITPQNKLNSISVGDGTLRFVQSPNQISFKSIPVPTKKTTYGPTIVDTSLIVADGRVAKNQWHLLVRESQPMKSTTTNKTINQAFVYRKNGQDTSITTIASEAYAYTSPDNNNVVISWNQQNGVFLNLSPSVNINVNESYTAQLQWILSDTPI